MKRKRPPHPSRETAPTKGADAPETPPLPVSERDGTVRLNVRVRPNASKTSFLGVRNGAFEFAIAAPPVDGAANEELVRFCAKTLRVPKQHVTIIVGAGGRNKVLAMAGVDTQTVQTLFAAQGAR